jgi:hypothetical protein
MELTLGQAAKLTGNGKTTLARAIKAGRLSATRRDDGSYAIDASELARVYHVTPETGSPTGYTASRTTIASDPNATASDPEVATRLAVAEAELRAMKDMLDEVRQSRDHWQAQAERLALTAPILAPAPIQHADPHVAVSPESPRRRSWFGWRKAG